MKLVVFVCMLVGSFVGSIGWALSYPSGWVEVPPTMWAATQIILLFVTVLLWLQQTDRWRNLGAAGLLVALAGIPVKLLELSQIPWEGVVILIAIGISMLFVSECAPPARPKQRFIMDR